MKHFLLAVFRITPFQLILILGFTALKYGINASGFGRHLQMPLVFISIGAILAFLAAVGMGGFLQDNGYTSESWLAARPDSKWRLFMVRIQKWGLLLPIALGYAFSMHQIAPTSWVLFLTLLAGMVVRNAFDFLLRRGRVSG